MAELPTSIRTPEDLIEGLDSVTAALRETTKKLAAIISQLERAVDQLEATESKT